MDIQKSNHTFIKNLETMTIKFKNFTLKPGNAKDRFDVFQTKTTTVTKDSIQVRKGNLKEGSTVQREVEEGYDMHLENAIDKIIRLSLGADETVTDLFRRPPKRV